MKDKKNLLDNRNVGIYIVIENHYSLLDVILRSLKPFKCKITLFISKELSRYYQIAGEIVAIEEVSSSKWVGRGQIKKMEGQDLMIFDELTSFRELGRFSSLKLTAKRIQIVHDCNTWFKPVAPKSVKDSLKYLFTRGLKKRCAIFAVAGANMKRYVEEKFPSTPVFLIPFDYANYNPDVDAAPEYQPGDRLRVCIPGTISPRRNYDRMIAALCIPPLKQKIILDVLGRPIGEYGLTIIKRLKQLKRQGYSVLFNEGYIANEVFEKSIIKAHILLSDFDVKYKTNNGQQEIYGISKETGITSLMLNKAKVGLLPSSFSQMEEIQNQTLFFKDTRTLSQVICSICKNEVPLEKLHKHAVANAMKMDIREVSGEILNAYKIQLENA